MGIIFLPGSQNYGVVAESITGSTINTGGQGVTVSRMPAPLRDAEFGRRLYELVRGLGLMDASMPLDGFLYQMSLSDAMPAAGLKPIPWIGTKQHLREVLQGVYDSQLRCQSLTMAAVERQVLEVFVDKDGKKMSLAKPKPVPSRESDAISDFFATLSDPPTSSGFSAE